MDFYCKVGSELIGYIETTTPWGVPNLDNTLNWYNQWASTPGIENYEIYLVGNFAERTFGDSPLATWDVDVAMVSDSVKNNNELYYLLSEAVRLGFENRILIDISWNNKLLNINTFEPFKQVRAFNHFYKKRNDDIYEFFIQGENVKELDGGLWEITHNETPKSLVKAKERLDNGTYKGIQKNIKDLIIQ